MLNVFGVVYCLSVVFCAISLIVLAVVDVVEHFQYKKEIKLIEMLEELEVRRNEDNA